MKAMCVSKWEGTAEVKRGRKKGRNNSKEGIKERKEGKRAGGGVGRKKRHQVRREKEGAEKKRNGKRRRNDTKMGTEYKKKGRTYITYRRHTRAYRLAH